LHPAFYLRANATDLDLTTTLREGPEMPGVYLRRSGMLVK
jgi:hypothetical protein